MPINKQILTPETVRQAAYGLMTADQLESFKRDLEIDFAISEPGLGRFRVNVFYQRGYPAMVLRYISADMPQARCPRPARDVQGTHHDEARAHPDGGRHGLRQVHVASPR